MIPTCKKILHCAILIHIAFYIFSSNTIYSQTVEIDSLKVKIATEKMDSIKVNDLLALGANYIPYNQSLALECFNKALSYSTNLKYQKGMAHSYLYIGQYYEMTGNYSVARENYYKAIAIYYQLNSNKNIIVLLMRLSMLSSTEGMYDKANEYINKALKYAEYYKYDILKASVLKNIGMLKETQLEYDSALVYYFKAYAIHESFSDSLSMVQIMGNIAGVYQTQGDYEKSFEFMQKELDYLLRHKHYYELAIVLNNTGKALESQGKIDEGLAYYLKAKEVAEKRGNDKDKAMTLRNIGICYSKKGNYAVANVYILESLEIYRKLKIKNKIVSCLLELGGNYIKIGSLTQAESLLKEAVEISLEENYATLLHDAYLYLTDVYEKNGDYKSAFFYYKSSIAIRDSIQKISDKEKEAALLVKFGSELKEKQNTILKQDIENKSLKLSNQKRTIVFMIGGIVISIILVLILFYLFRLKKRSNRMLEEQKTNLKILNRELKEAIETKDKFFAIMSHDLKNPILGIETCGRMLTENYDAVTEDEKRELIQENYDAAKRVSVLLENLLTWAKCQSGKVKPVKEKVDLRKLIEEVVSIYQLVFEKKNLKFSVEADAGINLYTDRNMLAAVLRNLISNAIKFTPSGGDILVKAEVKGKDHIIEVRDNGRGMSEHDLNKLFNSATSFSKKGTAGEKGTGLGLLVCHEFIELLGGTIWAESEEGKGTSFRFKLP